ncbi:DUF3152 domain-containing protein [Spirillospora sp. NPDC127200]
MRSDMGPGAGPGAGPGTGFGARFGTESGTGPGVRPGSRSAARRRRPLGKIVIVSVAGVVALGGAGTAAALALGGDDGPASGKAGAQGTGRKAGEKTGDKAGEGAGRGGGAAAGRSRRSARPAVVVNGRRQPPVVKSPVSASGRYAVVPGTAAAPAGRRGTTVRYMVEVERGLPFSAAQFAAEVHRVLNDPRSWGRGGTMRFVRVASGPVRFRVSLSSPALTDRLCLPLRTGGELSCRAGARSIINARRWGEGAVTYGRDLAAYREYVINHEVGHALGHGHQNCPGPGRRAPVMVQQTKSLYGCRTNPWPFPKG